LAVLDFLRVILKKLKRLFLRMRRFLLKIFRKRHLKIAKKSSQEEPGSCNKTRVKWRKTLILLCIYFTLL
jgi:hypothetical protein